VGKMIPDKVNICGHEVLISYQKEATCQDNGLVDLWGLNIHLNDGCSESLKEMTLSHEILHCLIRISGANYFLDNKSSEEVVAKSLQIVFWRFLKDNTDFFEKK
jgi:hypothetical protein